MATSKACEALNERLAAYAVGEDDAEVRAHVAGCEACRVEVRSLRRLLGVVSSTKPNPIEMVKDERFWNDFSSGVRLAYAEADRARRQGFFARLGALLGRPLFVGAVCAAASVVLVASYALRRASTPTVASEPARPAARPVTHLPVVDEWDLDDGQLRAMMAGLEDGEGEETDDAALVGGAATDDALNNLDDEELSRVYAALAKGV